MILAAVTVAGASAAAGYVVGRAGIVEQGEANTAAILQSQTEITTLRLSLAEVINDVDWMRRTMEAWERLRQQPVNGSRPMVGPRESGG